MSKYKIDEVWLERIQRSLEDLEYGSVQIIVHDSKITQIERLEKFRYPMEKAKMGKMNELKKVNEDKTSINRT